MKKWIHRIVLLALAGPLAEAAIVISGVQNIEIPTGMDGVYVDLSDGSTSSSEFSGWDVNFFLGGTGIYAASNFQPVREGTEWSDAVLNLSANSTVTASSKFYTEGINASSDHLGSGEFEFTVGEEGYLGFQYTADSIAYSGWMRVTLTNNTSGGIIHEWAWNDSGEGIVVGAFVAIPEPSQLLLILSVFLAICIQKYTGIGEFCCAHPVKLREKMSRSKAVVYLFSHLEEISHARSCVAQDAKLKHCIGK